MKGRDFTLFALVDGVVSYDRFRGGKTRVHIDPPLGVSCSPGADSSGIAQTLSTLELDKIGAVQLKEPRDAVCRRSDDRSDCWRRRQWMRRVSPWKKHVPRGGPSGGDGGKGGDVILQADGGLSTLLDLRYQRRYQAPRGEHGQGHDRNGRSGKDRLVRVPCGTIVYDEDNRCLADLTESGQEFVAARGGRGRSGQHELCHPRPDRHHGLRRKGSP